MKTKAHLALNVNDLERSVRFYQTLFGVPPVKHKPGYAKFDLEDPPLNLTLQCGKPVRSNGALNHLGIQVASTQQVMAAKERLARANLAVTEELNVDCCYALQDKIWIIDPNGYRWEIFVVKVADTRPDLNISAQTDPRPCCLAE